MAVVTAALSVASMLAIASQPNSPPSCKSCRSPQADSLPLEIGGVDYRPAIPALPPGIRLPKIKSVFWHNNIIAFRSDPRRFRTSMVSGVEKMVLTRRRSGREPHRHVSDHAIPLSDGKSFSSAPGKTNPWWKVEGRWFSENRYEAIVAQPCQENSMSKLAIR